MDRSARGALAGRMTGFPAAAERTGFASALPAAGIVNRVTGTRPLHSFLPPSTTGTI